ncbi:MAG: replication restart helicase PriA, partial [Planctomycetota bacterium]
MTDTPEESQSDPTPADLVEVALPVRVERTYTYAVPPGMAIPLAARVLVPFGKRKEVEGYVVGFPSETGVRNLKAVKAVLDERPLLSPAMLGFTRWIAEYYRAPWGEVLSASVPPGARHIHAGGRDRKVVLAVSREEAQAVLEKIQERYPGQARILQVLLGRESGEMPLRDLVLLCGTSYSPVNTLAKHKWVKLETDRRPTTLGVPEAGPAGMQLTPAQAESLEGISAAIEGGAFSVFLLRGVTGSGKTEVYLQAIEKALRLGRQSISLVPEISLTPQMVGRYLARFPKVAVLHSSLTTRERGRQWESISKGEAQVVVGARSAVFAPVPNLGVLVVDEEHEPSFKQDSTPRYHARDAAIMRARSEGAVVILGSATPSLESHHNAEKGKYGTYVLPFRVKDLPLPEVDVVDLSIEARETGRLPVFSRRLEGRIQDALARREQVILFLNRRGFSSFLQCPHCGHHYECPHCRIALTYH